MLSRTRLVTLAEAAVYGREGWWIVGPDPADEWALREYREHEWLSAWRRGL